MATYKFPHVSVSKYAVPRVLATEVENNAPIMLMPFRAQKGPANELVMISSYEQFLEKFGSEESLFAYSDTQHELLLISNWLASGGRVLAYRMVDTTDAKDNMFATATLEAKYSSGSVTESIVFNSKYPGIFYKGLVVELVRKNDRSAILNIRVSAGSNALESITIPDTVVDIDDFAFAFCSALDTVVLPAALKTIGDNAFFSCSALKTADMSQLEHLGEICTNAFAFCTSLTDVVLPDSLYKICSGAFERCDSITEIVIPESVEYLQSGAFISCAGLERATVNAKAERLPHAIFMGCNGLKEVVIGGTIEMIELTAVANCPLLEKLVLPHLILYFL